MKSRLPDPLRLDLLSFTADAAELAGEWAGDELTRLADSQSPLQDTQLSAVGWRLSGERVAVPVGEPEIWLKLQASTLAWLTCQRCLQPFQELLDVDQRLRFVRDEAQAETLDAESEDDVLALPRWLDARELIEDELLLALPLVPRHPHCPTVLPMSCQATHDEAPAERPNPFAVLQNLKLPAAPGKG